WSPTRTPAGSTSKRRSPGAIENAAPPARRNRPPRFRPRTSLSRQTHDRVQEDSRPDRLLAGGRGSVPNRSLDRQDRQGAGARRESPGDAAARDGEVQGCPVRQSRLNHVPRKNLISISGEHPMSEQPTVADYIVRRLAREGITDCFGVPGDFAFQLCDAVARSEAIRWIGCSNELDAAYAADGYARVRGCSMLLTTYAVGE